VLVLRRSAAKIRGSILGFGGEAYSGEPPKIAQGLASDAKIRYPDPEISLLTITFSISTSKSPFPSGSVKVFHRQV